MCLLASLTSFFPSGSTETDSTPQPSRSDSPRIDTMRSTYTL